MLNMYLRIEQKETYISGQSRHATRDNFSRFIQVFLPKVGLAQNCNLVISISMLIEFKNIKNLIMSISMKWFGFVYNLWVFDLGFHHLVHVFFCPQGNLLRQILIICRCDEGS